MRCILADPVVHPSPHLPCCVQALELGKIGALREAQQKKKALKKAIDLLSEMDHMTHLLYDVNYSVLHFNELDGFKENIDPSLVVFIENL